MANSMKELMQEIRKQAEKAMQIVQAKAEADMYKETGNFYTSGNPRLYQRTGNLGSSPRTTGLSSGGNTISFEAYLDPGDYTAANARLRSMGFSSYFSPLQVLTAAEHGASHILGRPGFWERSEEQIEKDLNEVMAQFFS